MDNIETRIYLFTGFLESGKTTFANDTIVNTNFCDGEQTVMIITEEGEKEFDKNELKKKLAPGKFIIKKASYRSSSC